MQLEHLELTMMYISHELTHICNRCCSTSFSSVDNMICQIINEWQHYSAYCIAKRKIGFICRMPATCLKYTNHRCRKKYGKVCGDG